MTPPLHILLLPPDRLACALIAHGIFNHWAAAILYAERCRMRAILSVWEAMLRRAGR